MKEKGQKHRQKPTGLVLLYVSATAVIVVVVPASRKVKGRSSIPKTG